jgi:tetratricopeptide (TPR) repeat protein
MRRKKHAYGLLIAAALLALAAVAPAPAHAGDGDGGTRSVFSIGAGSRAIGLGRAFVSLADDASAVYWNPAALRNVQQTQLMFMYMPVFGDFTGADYVYFGAVYPTLSAGAFGLGFQRIGTTFDAYDEFSSALGEQNYSESQALISYAFERHSKWVMGTLATGASFKIVSQNVDPFSSTAPGVDLGFRWIPDAMPELSVGLNFQDISGAEQKLNVDTDVTYRTIMAGAGYTYTFDNGSLLRVLLQLDLPEKADSRFHLGAEYEFTRYIALRAGYDEGNISFGLGVDVTAVADLGFDYAYLTRDEAGSSHPVSFTVGVGKTLDEKRRDIAEAQAAELEALIQQQFESRVAESRTRAKQYEAEGDFAGALDEWKIVLEFIPGDAEATEGEARARERVLAAQAAATQNAANRAIIQTRFEQGLEFYEANNLVRAMSEWRTILAIDSTHAGASDYRDRTQAKIDEAVAAHVLHAGELETAGRYTEAIGEWNNVQQYDPGSPEAAEAIQRLRDRIETQSQNYESAQRTLRIVNLYDQALNLYNQGEYGRSLENLDQLLRLQPDHEEARRLRAMATRKTTPLTEQETQQIRSLYLAGMQHFAKDEYAKAIEQWKKILEIDPTNESVQRNIDEAQQRLRQLENR